MKALPLIRLVLALAALPGVVALPLYNPTTWKPAVAICFANVISATVTGISMPNTPFANSTWP